MHTTCFEQTERLCLLQEQLEGLKFELAAAWVSADHRDKIPAIEKRIRHVWSQIDGLGLILGEPPAGAPFRLSV